jgi:hypothetical protein
MEAMMLKFSPLAGTPTLVRQVTGLSLAYQLRGRNADQRAVLAVTEFGDADWALVNPTDRQLARIFGVSEYQLRQARDLDAAQRWGVAYGFRRLSNQTERLAKAVRTAGPDATWDALIGNLG